jgi:hypothetical protein
MANKNFTQFGLSSFASPTDFIVGYDSTGAQELRYNASNIRNTTYALGLLTGGSFDFNINGVDVGIGKNNISDNTAVGRLALRAAGSSASGNLAVGYTAANALTGGTYNVFMGYQAGGSFTGGGTTGYNVAIGYQAMQLARGSCRANIGIGQFALQNIVNANENVIIGDFQGYYLTGGNANTFVGKSAGSLIYAGENNTYLGTSAGLGNNAAINCSALGYQATTTGNNQVQLGSSGTTPYAYAALQIRSDIRDKADVRDTALGLDFIMALRPVDYKWDLRDDYKTEPPELPFSELTEEQKQNHDLQVQEWQRLNNISNIVHDGTHKRSRYHHGLIAQEVKQVIDDKGIDFGGYQDHAIQGGKDVQSIGYDELVAPLIKAIQELKQEFDAYKASHS